MPILPTDDFGERIQALRPNSPQAVPIDAGSHASLPFGAKARVVRVVATTHCFLAFGPPGVTATPADHYLPAYAPEYFSVLPGETIAATRAAGDGTLHLSEMQ